MTSVSRSAFSDITLEFRWDAEMTEVRADIEAKIAAELLAAQGTAVDIGGYYRPDEAGTAAAMRPSATLNAIIDAM